MMNLRTQSTYWIQESEEGMLRAKAVGLLLVAFLLAVFLHGAFLLVPVEAADQIPVLVVYGSVTNAQGSKAVPGLTVQVKNAQRGIAFTGMTNANGEYAITMVRTAPAEELVVAAVGETIVAEVLDSSGGISGSTSKQLTSHDIEAASLSLPIEMGGDIVAVSVAESVLPALTDSTTQVIVTVTDGDGNTVTDTQLSLSLTPPIGSLSPVQNMGNGTYTATYTAGTTLVTVAIGANTNSGQGETTVKLVEGPPAEVSVSVTPQELVADGKSNATVTMSVTDAANHPIPALNPILSLSPQIGELSKVTDRGDGSYTATYTAGTDLGDVSFTARVGDLQDTDTLMLVVGPPVDVTLVIAPVELPADGTSTAILTIQIVDAAQHPLTDEDVILTLSPQNGEISPITETDGIYTATYTAGTSLDDVSFTARTTNGRSATTSLELVVGVPAKILLTVVPSELSPGQTADIEAIVTDATGHALPNAEVSFSLAPQNGTLSNINGQTATYTAGDTSGTVTLTAISGDITEQVTITLLGQLDPSPSRSSVEAPTINAGQKATITVTLRDANNRPVSGRGVRVTIEGIAQPLDADPTDAQGQTQVTTGILTETGTYPIHVQVLDDGPTLEGTDLVVLSASPNRVTIDDPGRVNVEVDVTITMHVSDHHGNPISGAQVQVQTDLGSITSPARNQGNGVYTASFRSNFEGQATIQATVLDGPTTSIQVDVVDTVARIYSGHITPLAGKAGSEFTITAEAEPDGEMTFTIADIPNAQRLPMQEGDSGSYEGVYRVPAADEQIPIEVSEAEVKLQLTDLGGNSAERLLEEFVKIDNVPPPAPELMGEDITPKNLTNVTLSARATAGRSISLEIHQVSPGEQTMLRTDSSRADVKGELVTWHLSQLADIPTWPDGDYEARAHEAPDELGNQGEVAMFPFRVKITPEPVKILHHLSPQAPVPYNTEVELQVTIVFFTTDVPETTEVEASILTPNQNSIFRLLELEPDIPKSIRFTADEPGVWEYSITWRGADPSVTVGDSFPVESASGTLVLTSPTASVRTGQDVAIAGELMPKKAGEDIQLQGIRPGSEGYEYLSEVATTNVDGTFNIGFAPDTNGIWKLRAVWSGLVDKDTGIRLYEPTRSEPLDIVVQYPAGKVVIAVGGDGSQHWKNTFFQLGRYVYDVHKRRGFPSRERILFLSPTPWETVEHESGIAPDHHELNLASLENAILEWGTRDLLPGEFLYIYLVSDNLKEGGLILKHVDNPGGPPYTERLQADEMETWLDELNAGAVNVVLNIESCYSGEFIRPVSDLPLKAKRVLIASASLQTQATIVRTDSFSRRFFSRLHRKETFRNALANTAEEVALNEAFLNREPWLDADGDGNRNEPEDWHRLSQLGILGDPDYDVAGDPAEILSWSEPRLLAKGIHQADIVAGIGGARVTASASILPPGLVLPEIESWQELETLWQQNTITLTGDENTGYEGTYAGFTTPGTYTIHIYAENIDGASIPALTSVTVPAPWDINADGAVDILDLVAVGTEFGQCGDDLQGDVNGDSCVDISDLVLIGQHFGEEVGMAAPMFNPQTSNANLESAIRALEAMSHPPLGADTARRVLRAWLDFQQPLVTETKLLPNYPNPFNPETWIPYQLAEPSDVTISIFDVTGHMVRQLALGQQLPGIYRTPSRAAYWDGRNGLGEPAASGIYHYTIQAGDYTETRRMLLLK